MFAGVNPRRPSFVYGGSGAQSYCNTSVDQFRMNIQRFLNSLAMKGRKRAGLIAFCTMYLASAVSGIAQETGRSSGRNMLWRVQSGDRSLYILGSVHMLPESAYPLDPVIEKTFNEAEKVVFELNLDSVANMSGAMSLLKRGTYQNGRTLEKSISKETFEALKTRLKETGIPLAMVSRFEPWMVAMLLTATDMRGSGYSDAHGIDMYFHGKARETGKEVKGLETLDFQVDLFDNLPEEAQEAFLKQTLEMSSAGDSGMLDSMVAAWKSGDVERLEKIAATSMTDTSELSRNLLQKRNLNWIPEIEKFIASESKYFVIVGALHLVGESGVIELLRRKGYEVEQL